MTKRPERRDDGKYSIKGVKYDNLFGSRIQVWNGTAYKTTGELTKKDLVKNKWSRIVSRKKYKEGKKHNRLLEHGYTAKKGKFGYVKVKPARKTRRNRRLAGGEGEIVGGITQEITQASAI